MASHQRWQWTAGAVGWRITPAPLWGCIPPASPLVAAQTAVSTPDHTNYLLGPQDALEFSVWKEPDLAKQMLVRPDGKISYRLIGEVQAAQVMVSYAHPIHDQK